jgi:hypothetical protein
MSFIIVGSAPNTLDTFGVAHQTFPVASGSQPSPEGWKDLPR